MTSIHLQEDLGQLSNYNGEPHHPGHKLLQDSANYAGAGGVHTDVQQPKSLAKLLEQPWCCPVLQCAHASMESDVVLSVMMCIRRCRE